MIVDDLMKLRTPPPPLLCRLRRGSHYFPLAQAGPSRNDESRHAPGFCLGAKARLLLPYLGSPAARIGPFPFSSVFHRLEGEGKWF